LVLVLSNWYDFKDHAVKYGYMSEIVFRKEETRTNEIRIRITAGKFGLDTTLPRNDPTLEEMQDFLTQNAAKRIEDARDILSFFS
jgi:hypothetical protein